MTDCNSQHVQPLHSVEEEIMPTDRDSTSAALSRSEDSSGSRQRSSLSLGSRNTSTSSTSRKCTDVHKPATTQPTTSFSSLPPSTPTASAAQTASQSLSSTAQSTPYKRIHEGMGKPAQVQLRCQKPMTATNEELEDKEEEAFEGWGEADRVKMW